jgi:glycosyltransferase involved in cell wall biosynthesis
MLAHGGLQSQIEQTQTALQKIGVEVEPLRWWDDARQGDLIHNFGVVPLEQIQQARAKKIPIVMTTLFTATCNRGDFKLRLQGSLVKMILKLPFGESIKQQLAWRSFGLCPQNVVGLEAEKRVLELVYGVPADRISVVPLGLPDIFLNARPAHRSEDYLVCAGTITERKNCISLAQLARKTQTPILFVGKPYSEYDPYWTQFNALIDGKWVRHQPHVADPASMIDILQKARGAVIMSRYENWCLAAHEAAACDLPVLLPPLKWARERFGDEAHYFTGNLNRDAEILKEFYERSPAYPAPRIRLYRWKEAAEQLRAIYERVLSTSR